MRLSEAIRLGATLKPQGFGSFFDISGRSCAFGAAMDALGMEPEPVIRLYPFLNKLPPVEARMPHCCGSVMAAIITLNDRQRWSRERIADWLATFEPEAEPDPEPDEVPVLVEQAA